MQLPVLPTRDRARGAALERVELPTDEATLKERQEHERFFKEMRKREF